MTHASISSPHLFLFFQRTDSLKSCIKQAQSYLIIPIYRYAASYKSYISLKAVARRCSISKVLLKISQSSLESTCTGVSFVIMLRAVASVACEEYIIDNILTHVPAFLSSNSFRFCFLS